MLTPKQEESLSKFMSEILRHTPEQFGLELDHEGYCDILRPASRNKIRE